MVTRTRDVVNIRLEGTNRMDVELIAAKLADVLGDRFAITGSAPNKRDAGLRVYGLVLGYGIGERYPEEARPKKRRSRNASEKPKSVL